MIESAAVLEPAGTVSSSSGDSGSRVNQSGVRPGPGLVGLVRAGFGTARGRGPGPAQGSVRSESALLDEPPLRVADPRDERVPLPGAGDRPGLGDPGRPPPGELARHAAALRLDPASGRAGGMVPDLRLGVAAGGGGDQLAPGARPGAACGRCRADGPGQLPDPRRLGGDPGGVDLGRGPGQGAGARRRGRCRRRVPRMSS